MPVPEHVHDAASPECESDDPFSTLHLNGLSNPIQEGVEEISVPVNNITHTISYAPQ